MGQRPDFGGSDPGSFAADIAREIWEAKYRYRPEGAEPEPSVAASWGRVAGALAAVEAEPAAWRTRFFGILEDFRFLPGGRILAGAGTPRRVTLFNCFVMGLIEDSLDGIFEALKEGALTMQQGGGVGYDFSTLRPRGAPARRAGAIASGPVSFMRIWDATCATLLSTGSRRGAMMATLRCDHPDIGQFIDAKRTPGELRHFNLSVLVTDELVRAVRAGADWPLVFPAGDDEPDGERLLRRWSGADAEVPCRVHARVPARDLWERLMRATYDNAEPGVLFVDRVNRLNNLWYREQISATNPCGELPLPPYGACDLGSINLAAFVREPFTPRAALDLDAAGATAAVAVRLLDDVIDAAQFPLPRQAEMARGARRIGLGVTGLADALLMLGRSYAGEQARSLAAGAMAAICHAAYRASIAIAREKGPFPFFAADPYLAGAFVRGLPVDIRDGIRRHGIRNSHLIAIAPTGTISLLAGNVSSGLEPVYEFVHRRRVLQLDGTWREHEVADRAFALWRREHPEEPLPAHFETAQSIDPVAHLQMQAALQPFVDSSISKTINVPADYPYERFAGLYELAFDRGLKGCTTFRPNPVTGSILEPAGDESLPHCCSLDREAD
jgi:ribonucleoside-diphosphate reductase alpha chain